MPTLPRLLAGLCTGLLAAGAAGIAVHHDPHRGGSHHTASGASARLQAPPATIQPGATSTVLAAGLITPTDMGGYYRVDPRAATDLLDSAPCLAGLQPSPVQSGRAATALLGPDDHAVPTIVEVVDSYPGADAAAVYRSVTAALGACSSLALSFAGTPVTAAVSSTTIPPVGDADRVWSGSFRAADAAFTIEYGTVLGGSDVISLVWIDSSPPSDPVMGSFTSTMSLAIGKLS